MSLEFTAVMLLLIIIGVFVIRIPIIIAKTRGVNGGNLTVVAILSWLGIFFGLTWIIALILALVYQSQVNIANTVTGHSVYLSRNNEEHITKHSDNIETTTILGLDKLEKLYLLKEKGAITEKEYQTEKNKILNSI